MEFSDWQWTPEILNNINTLGYKVPTPIQEKSIPIVLSGQDLAGLAQTGTGKTAAFLLPLIERVMRSQSQETDELTTTRRFPDWKSNHFILVLLPTRELAEQVLENFVAYTQNLPLKGMSIYGGIGYDKQKLALKNGVQFIFATPGRLIDLYKDHLIDLRMVRAVVFDEADRMFDMGFKDDMKFVLERVPKERQFLVFSATLNLDVMATAYQFGANPVEINISRDKATADNVKDYLFHVGDSDKPQHLISLLKKYNSRQTIIFTNFKNNVERVAQFLSANQFPAIAISSLMTQQQRTRVLEQFKAVNEKNILVATDIAARGLDIQGVDLVINYELPMDCETYVHRIGRTGRANAEGTALNLCSDRDIDSLARIEDFLKRKIPNDYLETTELVTDFNKLNDGRREYKSNSGFKKPEFDRDNRDKGRRDGPRRQSGHRDQTRDQAGPKDHSGPREAKKFEKTSPHKEASAPVHSSKKPSMDRPKRDPVQKEFTKKDPSKGGSYKYKKSAHGSDRKGKSSPTPVSKAGLKTKVVGFFKKLFS